MSESQYLLRFDDICPTMNWAVWEAIEAHLVKWDVRPILAVVPDNKDPKLDVDAPRADFWEQVRRWQSMGWTIALHGYEHRYVNKNPGIMGITAQSEFAGLPREEQEAKLKKGLAIFAEHGVVADAWVAPSHSFDWTTVSLLRELGVPVISDGHCPWPHADASGMVWVPQQLWGFRTMPAGVWTVCNHHNDWTDKRVAQLGEILASGTVKMADMKIVAKQFADKPQTLGNRWQGWSRHLWERRVRGGISSTLRALGLRRGVRA